jgi:hypothetical protein
VRVELVGESLDVKSEVSGGEGLRGGDDTGVLVSQASAKSFEVREGSLKAGQLTLLVERG